MGWWSAPGHDEIVVGDIPLDLVGKLLEELQVLYIESLGRRPKLEEIRYLIELSIKVNGPSLFCGEDLKSHSEDVGMGKGKTKKYTAGDVLSFKIADGLYGFARLIKQIELGYVSEIFAETSSSPREELGKLQTIKQFPVILDTFSLLEMGEGEWEVVGHLELGEDDRVEGLRFVFGTPPYDLKSIDVNENEKKISEQEAMGLFPYEQMGDEDVKELF
ncbi:hypothetical protein PPUN12996_38640 [Pseudomonas putida]|uniref:Imm26 family immunity protein n=1 Tax=Pseudomonas sp. ABFPK TaxID=1636605 RepID=UPI000778B41A|nr:Imm26 family immunity protein [Pseudomonas sp. ABFPK]KYC14155.1 cytoplasmic protein [Pseudomonas sp. ABFPK]OII58185.1 cytoplasmic protein [Pseudomonas putida]GLO31806.1 hypothetical protein PPUN12996_38640 [Pseudomonas putida]